MSNEICDKPDRITLLQDENIQLKARVKELEISINSLAESSLTVIRYLQERSIERCKHCTKAII